MSESAPRNSQDLNKSRPPRRRDTEPRFTHSKNYSDKKRKPRFTPEVVHGMLFETKPRAISEPVPYVIPRNDPLADMDEFFFDNEDKTNTDSDVSDTSNSATGTTVSHTDNPTDDIIAVAPTLLSETSFWKGRSLNENSLLHLLTLTLLYRNHFFDASLVKSNNTSTASTDEPPSSDATEIPTHTLTQWQAWQHWIKELSESKDFFLNQELPENYFALVFRQAQMVVANAPLAQEEIAKYLIGWKWERLTIMRKLVLLVSWVLIKNASSQQVKPLLNDAINHAKWFGDEQETGFVNSILDKLISEYKLWPQTK